jgi:hypothetical protein
MTAGNSRAAYMREYRQREQFSTLILGTKVPQSLFFADPFRWNTAGILVSSILCTEIFGIKLATSSKLRNNAMVVSLKAGI